MSIFLLAFDASGYDELETGRAPRTAFSHDQNLFQLAHVALKKGHRVFICSDAALGGGECREAVEIYPLLLLRHRRREVAEIGADILLNAHPQLLKHSGLRDVIKVAIHPALYFIEMPYTYSAQQTADLFESIQLHVDYMIVQNARMKEFVSAVYQWVAGWREPDRILVSPLGVLPDVATVRMERDRARALCRLAPDDLALVNGGGVWRWTDVETFLQGFIAAVREGHTRLKLFMTGLRQSDNTDHGEYIAGVEDLLAENADLVRRGPDIVSRRPAEGGHIFVETDWAAGSLSMPLLLSAADMGLNVNKDTLENWQAHRVRLLDYARYELPVLSTAGDLFSDLWGADAAEIVHERTREGYRRALTSLATSPDIWTKLRAGARKLKSNCNSEHDYGVAIDILANGARRDKGRGERSVLDLHRENAAEAICGPFVDAFFGLAKS